MEKIVIHGGVRLKGEVTISGAKNAALPILCSTLLTEGKTTLYNTPDVTDVKTMGRLLEMLGADIEIQDNKITIDTSSINSYEAPYELVKTMRASVLVLGPLVSRFGKAMVSLPGGCAIGARPINLHLMGLEKMGAEIKIEHGYINMKAKKLKGTRFYFDIPTVGGTENLMMAATLAEGRTVIENAACEPEISDLASMLRKMGACIQGDGTDKIIIDGVNQLKPAEHTIIPDRIETGTFMIAAGITKGDILIRGCIPEHLDAIIEKLKEIGVEILAEKEGLRARGEGKPRSVDIRTMPYPGFPTDMQAQMMALMCIADGLSVISETVFENRFMHIAELRRMGANITVKGNNAIVQGVDDLSGAPLMATDLRASASLILAGLAARGETTLSRVYHIDRGYERIEEKLAILGADIERIKE
ncbi:MAG: UDP-N-acetylglucosamine 1-carboxyvinyltransferase [Nitrospirota bacterium]